MVSPESITCKQRERKRQTDRHTHTDADTDTQRENVKYAKVVDPRAAHPKKFLKIAISGGPRSGQNPSFCEYRSAKKLREMTFCKSVHTKPNLL